MSIKHSTRYGTRYGVRATRSGVSFGKRVPGGNLPHGDPKLARLGVRQTPRAWAGYGGTEEITAEEEALLGERIWQTSSAAEAAATGETALITAEEAAVLGEVGAGSVVYTLGWGAIAAGFAAVAVAAVGAYEVYEHWDDITGKKRKSPQSVLPETPDPKRRNTIHPGWTGTTNVKRHLDFGTPLSSPDPKRNKPSPGDPKQAMAAGGDFAGLVQTFYNPTTNKIIGYKGIARKHRYTALTEYSEFWRRQMTPMSQLVASS